LVLYVIPIGFGIVIGLSEINLLHQVASIIAGAFMRVFNFLSLPLISLAIIVTITNYQASGDMKTLSARTLQYIFGTTIIAATIACLLYISIAPKLPEITLTKELVAIDQDTDFKTHLLHLLPINVFEPFLEHRVISILLMSIAIAIATRQIPNIEHRTTVINFFQGWYDIFIVLTRWVVKIIPIALYAFITVSIIEFKQGQDFNSIFEYLLVVVLANLVQG
jgi:Na+/H+-dicarboxylate symporter